MTIGARNRVRVLFLFFSAILTLFALFAYAYSFIKEAYIMLPQNLAVGERLGVLHFSYAPLAVSSASLFFSLISFSFSLYTYFAFKKIQSDEIFYFELFLFSINWEALRLLPPLFLFSPSILQDLIYISRLLYFFRFMAIFSLLGMALFSIKTITKEKFFVVFFLIFTSLMLAMSQVFDSTQMSHFFLLSPSPFTKTYVVLFVVFSFFILSTVFISYIYNSVPERFRIIGGAISLILGYVFLLVSYDYILAFASLFLFLYGMVNIIKNIHAIYLWQ